MKRTYTSLAVIVLSCLATGVLARQPMEPGAAISKLEAARFIRMEEARKEWKQEYEALRASGLREALEDTDVIHCDLSVEVRPDDYINLLGQNTLTVRSLVDNLTTFTFRLRSQYTITSATINGGRPVTVSNVSSSTRVVTLDKPYQTNEPFELTIVYSGHAYSSAFGSIEFTSHYGTDLIYTLSEAYYSYTWWPAKDGDVGEGGSNEDKFTIDISITTPDSLRAAANGVLESVSTPAFGKKRYNWSTDYPISSYLVCFGVTNYNTWTVNYMAMDGTVMPVLFYIYPEHDSTYNRQAWEVAVDGIYVLRDLYGEYPFKNEKYGIYECNFGGGMEHQTFTAQGTFDEHVTIHELGHQWWGDMITCKNWNNIWINEGFARYTEALWDEYQGGSSNHTALINYMNGIKYTGSGSVYVYDDEVDSMYDIFDTSTTYNKAGWVVHMMRGVLGSDTFFDALQAYRAAFEYSVADTEDFQGICEQFYGESLQWFFDEWIYGERCPQYSYGWSSTRINDQDYLLLYINQTQYSSYQRFTMPIEVKVNGVLYKVFNDHDPEHYVVPVHTTPTSVQLDPNTWILNTGISSTSYVIGPPVIVETSPAPGETISTADTDSMTITFHQDVSIDATNCTLQGETTGSHAFTLTYNSTTQTATIAPDAPLPADEYTLSIADSVVSASGNRHLDGEISNNILPSGEGIAGGDAQIVFTVAGNPGDSDGDGDVDLADFAIFQACWSGEGIAAISGCEEMLLDEDNDVDADDYAAFENLMSVPLQ